MSDNNTIHGFPCTDTDTDGVVFVNTTPHEVKIYGEGGELLFSIPAPGKGGPSVRVRERCERVGTVGGVPTVILTPAGVEGLPAPGENVFYVISGMALDNLRQGGDERGDVIAPVTSPDENVPEEFRPLRDPVKGWILGARAWRC
ncbi:MAG: hypothetical protein OEY01_03365 [Desulfobulbaceae bacterium]|nr:hypothetical protein [Desulfobulbaceae bacterium]